MSSLSERLRQKTPGTVGLFLRNGEQVEYVEGILGILGRSERGNKFSLGSDDLLSGLLQVQLIQLANPETEELELMGVGGVGQGLPLSIGMSGFPAVPGVIADCRRVFERFEAIKMGRQMAVEQLVTLWQEADSEGLVDGAEERARALAEENPVFDGMLAVKDKARGLVASVVEKWPEGGFLGRYFEIKEEGAVVLVSVADRENRRFADQVRYKYSPGGGKDDDLDGWLLRIYYSSHRWESWTHSDKVLGPLQSITGDDLRGQYGPLDQFWGGYDVTLCPSFNNEAVDLVSSLVDVVYKLEVALIKLVEYGGGQRQQRELEGLQRKMAEVLIEIKSRPDPLRDQLLALNSDLAQLRQELRVKESPVKGEVPGRRQMNWLLKLLVGDDS